jgi:hypothetical protein
VFHRCILALKKDKKLDKVLVAYSIIGELLNRSENFDKERRRING